MIYRPTHATAYRLLNPAQKCAAAQAFISHLNKVDELVTQRMNATMEDIWEQGQRLTNNIRAVCA